MSDKKGNKSGDIFSQFQEDHRPTTDQLAIYFPSALALTLIPLCTFLILHYRLHSCPIQPHYHV
jgi:hypothetical protein